MTPLEVKCCADALRAPLNMDLYLYQKVTDEHASGVHLRALHNLLLDGLNVVVSAAVIGGSPLAFPGDKI